MKQSPLSNQPVPLYEDVNVLPSASAAVEHQEQGLEMRENVAMAHGTQESMLAMTPNVAYGPTSLRNGVTMLDMCLYYALLKFTPLYKRHDVY